MFRLTLGHTLLGNVMPILSRILPTSRPYACPAHAYDAVVLGIDLRDLRPMSDQRWVTNASMTDSVMDELPSENGGFIPQSIIPVVGASPVTGMGVMGIVGGLLAVDFTAVFGANGSTRQSYERGVRLRTG